MAMSVTLVDASVAFIAGLVVIPAMYVAMQKEVKFMRLMAHYSARIRCFYCITFDV